MPAPTFSFSAVLTSIRSVLAVFADLLTFFRLSFRSPAAVSAENLFLRKQLGLYVERKVKPRRATNAIRFTLARLSRFFDWRSALTIVKPDHADPLASQRVSPLLEMEITAMRSTSRSRPTAETDRRYGNEQSDLGR